MIIKCPKCESRYKIEGSSLPDEGTQAKCSSCGNEFFVQKKSLDKVAPPEEREAPGNNLGNGDPFDNTDYSMGLDSKSAADDFMDIDDLLASNMPEDEMTTDEIEEQTTDSINESIEDDIDALFADASNFDQLDEFDEEPENQLAEFDDIDDLLAGVDHSETSSKPGNLPEESAVDPLDESMDEIDAIFDSVGKETMAQTDEENEINAIPAANKAEANEPETTPEDEPVVQAPVEANMASEEKEVATTESVDSSQDNIDNLFEQSKEESTDAGANNRTDIDAILAANKAEANEPETTPEDEPAVQAPVEANMASEEKEIATTESVDSSQDNIDDLLEKSKDESKDIDGSSNRTDIDAILTANKVEETDTSEVNADAVTEKVEIPATKSADSSQDNIDNLFEQSKEESTGIENAEDSSDIDDLLSAVDEKPSSPGVEDIDNLLEANESDEMEIALDQEPEDDLAGAETVASDKQDDIDSLLASEADGSKEKAPDTADSFQSDIDDLLASETEDKDEEDMVEVGVDDQTDNSDDDLISQDDLDASFTEEEEPEDAMTGAFEEVDDEDDSDLISQDDIDALLYESDEDEEEVPAESIPVEAPKEEESLGSLLEKEESSEAEDIFSGEEEPVSAGAEQPEDEMAIPEAEAVMSAEHAKEVASEIVDDMDKALDKKAALIAKIKAIIATVTPKIKAIVIPSDKKGLIIRGAAAVVLVLLVSGSWFFFGGTSMEEQIVAQKDGKQSKAPEEAKPSKDFVDDDLMEDEDKGPTVSVGIYLPVEFDKEAIRIMSIDINLIFNSDVISDAVGKRMFYVVTILENAIVKFFEDKFYEETIFVQDKLEEMLKEHLKQFDQFAGLNTVEVEDVSFEGEPDPEPEPEPGAEGEAKPEE